MTTITYPELLHRGRAMDPKPVNHLSLFHVAHYLVSSGPVGSTPIVVVLEPGDATRYVIVLAVLPRIEQRAMGWDDESRAMLVSVCHGDGEAHSVVLDLLNIGGGWAGDHMGPDVAELSGGHPWTATLLEWWMTVLAVEVDAAARYIAEQAGREVAR